MKAMPCALNTRATADRGTRVSAAITRGSVRGGSKLKTPDSQLPTPKRFRNRRELAVGRWEEAELSLLGDLELGELRDHVLRRRRGTDRRVDRDDLTGLVDVERPAVRHLS